MSLEELFSWLATILAIGQQLTGIQICKRIIKDRKSDSVQFFPFVAMFTSCTVWLRYGILREDSAIIIVNICGSTLQFIYCFTYYIFTKQKSVVNKQITIGLFMLFPILIYTRFISPTRESAVATLGLYCCTVSVISYGSPLSSVKQVIRTQSTSVMSFPLVAFNVVLGGLWFIYGIIRHDKYIQVPNFIGFILGCLQASLFVLYPSRSSRTINAKSTVVI
ncbi:sugar transporter SWEET1-like [Tubulanus polymorphus]|uniref:sugar transporter SWEET1-like n=1 Tax=Tubulanus polymorphus TaxID=672921 RepID=UPI003DA5E984